MKQQQRERGEVGRKSPAPEEEIDYSGTGTSSVTSATEIKAYQAKLNSTDKAIKEQYSDLLEVLEYLPAKKEAQQVSRELDLLTLKMELRAKGLIERELKQRNSLAWYRKALLEGPSLRGQEQLSRLATLNDLASLQSIFAKENFLRNAEMAGPEGAYGWKTIRPILLARIFALFANPYFASDQSYAGQVLSWLTKEGVEKIISEREQITSAHLLACRNNADGLQTLFNWHQEHDKNEQLLQWYREVFTTRDQLGDDLFVYLADGIASAIEEARQPQAEIISTVLTHFKKFKELTLEEKVTAIMVAPESNHKQRRKRFIKKLFSSPAQQKQREVAVAVAAQHKLLTEQLLERTELTTNVLVQLENTKLLGEC